MKNKFIMGLLLVVGFISAQAHALISADSLRETIWHYKGQPNSSPVFYIDSKLNWTLSIDANSAAGESVVTTQGFDGKGTLVVLQIGKDNVFAFGTKDEAFDPKTTVISYDDIELVTSQYQH